MEAKSIATSFGHGESRLACTFEGGCLLQMQMCVGGLWVGAVGLGGLFFQLRVLF